MPKVLNQEGTDSGPASARRPERLLALDTAGTACSAAVWCAGKVRARRFEVMARGQSERLVPMIEAVMSEAGIAYGALDAVAVTLGPGGFTGVRIGLATARALALAWARPIIGVSNFEALAAAVPECLFWYTIIRSQTHHTTPDPSELQAAGDSVWSGRNFDR